MRNPHTHHTRYCAGSSSGNRIVREGRTGVAVRVGGSTTGRAIEALASRTGPSHALAELLFESGRGGIRLPPMV